MDDNDHDDLDAVPPDIMRVMQVLNQTWRRCRRKSCRRSRSCRGADVICTVARQPGIPRNKDKQARDDARAMAIFQRMLQQRLAEAARDQKPAAAQQRTKPRCRRPD